MKTTTRILIATMVALFPVYAVAGETSGSGILMTAFIGFLALIIAFQLIPALMLFFAMLKGVFAAVTSKPVGLGMDGEGRKP